MAYNNYVITRPVVNDTNGGDIQRALGTTSGDLATLCTHANINMFAKYKPTRYATLGDTGESAAAGESPNWWQAYNGLCGLTIPTSTNTASGPGTSSSAWYKLLHSSLMWGYEKPNGGQYPYRQNDFDGYKQDALPPFSPVSVTSFMIQANGDLTIQYEMNATGARELGLSDIAVGGTALSAWYFGVLVYYSNSLYTFIAQAVAASSSGQVTFSNMGDYAGKRVTIVPFLASGALAQGTSGNVTVISCNLAPVQVDILAYSSGIEVSWDEATWNAAKTKVTYAVSLINITARSITVRNIYITLRDDVQQLYSRTVSSVTIPAGTTVQIATGEKATTYDPAQSYWMGITTADGTTIPYEEIQVEESI